MKNLQNELSTVPSYLLICEKVDKTIRYYVWDFNNTGVSTVKHIFHQLVNYEENMYAYNLS